MGRHDQADVMHAHACVRLRNASTANIDGVLQDGGQDDESELGASRPWRGEFRLDAE